MRELSSAAFHAAVADEFDFLKEHGFRVPADGLTSSILTAGVVYLGRHVVVEVVLDRRDEFIECCVAPVGVTRGSSLFGYLVEYRGFRGSFSKFRDHDPGLPDHVVSLRTEARALKALAPDVIADSPSTFVVRPRERG